jgi:hypothetical protein
MISQIRIPIVRCTNGIYLRWWFNGWHYFAFTNNYEVVMKTTQLDVQVTQVFSVISKIERATKVQTEYAYSVVVTGVNSANIEGFNGLLLAELVEEYSGGKWYEVDITRGAHQLQEAGEPAYELQFEVTRKEMPNTPAVYQKTQLLYIGDTLCDMDDTEIIPQNKQVNDIAEMQDRQSDYTATFKVRKTRAMRALFELSGEVGASTVFPYRQHAARLVQDGIEVITAGNVVLNKNDDQYYYISIYSGNLNFFKSIEGKKLSDLTLASCDHIWTAVTQAASHASELDYIYPLCEPSDDGGIAPLTDTGDRVEMYGGWVWPFVKCKAIWDEIIAGSGYACTGEIFADVKWLRLHMPISNLALSNANIKPFLYNMHVINHKVMNASRNALDTVYGDVTCPLGDAFFYGNGRYITRFAGTYQLRVVLKATSGSNYVPTHVYLYNDSVQVAEFMDDGTYAVNPYIRAYTVTYSTTALDTLRVVVTLCGLAYYDIQIVDITDLRIDYLSNVQVANHLPDMLQTDFVKMICNLFALVPDAVPRDHKIRFWNYQLLIDNIPRARDWSAYLSEREDENEFTLGDYAQRNYLRYKETDDVEKDAGTGILAVDDQTLPLEKDIVQLPLATCDEVFMLRDVVVSRIAFNNYDAKTDSYVQNKSIMPRLVYVDRTREDLAASPPYQKVFGFRTVLSGGTSYDVTNPKKASSLEVAFSTLAPYYAPLARMLNKTNLRRAKFNLPAYEVAGFKHDVPVYLSQYKAYFHVNIIGNWVNGKLCTVELIKL